MIRSLSKVITLFVWVTASALAQVPVRDQAGAGTAIIRGRVTDSADNTALRGVNVSAVAADQVTGPNRPAAGTISVFTNGEGRYELRMPAGRYRVSTVFLGYLGLDFGQTRPAQAGKVITIGNNQVIDDVNIALPRGGAIAGTVRDATGDPMANVQVRALRPFYREGRKGMNAAPIVLTDDLGRFRLWGLAPGSIWLSVLSPAPGSAGGIPFENTGAGLAPTYYPGTSNFAEARPVVLKLGETVSDVDFTVVPVNNASIRGVVLDADGRVPSNMQVMANQVGPGLLFAFNARVQPDGSFALQNLTPGEYDVRATRTDRTGLVSIERLTLAPGEVRQLRPNLIPMTTGAGRIIVDGSITPRPALGSTILQIVPDSAGDVPFQARPSTAVTTVRVQADGNFTFSIPPGHATITPYTLPGGWFVKSMRMGDVDIADGLDFPASAALSNLEIELTNRPTEVTGTVRRRDGQSVDDYTVLIFAKEPAKRRGVTRYFAMTRPDTVGKFSARGLPPGEYLAAAVEWADADTSADPDFLASLEKDATPLVINEGAPLTLNLILVQ
jgi:hypothetical protein